MPEYLKCPPGTRLRVLKVVEATAYSGFVYGAGRVGLSCRSHAIEPGEEVVFLGQEYGPGSDPAFEARLRLADGRVVSVSVGWASLRADQFEKL